MGARWTIPADPDRLERAAQDHEIVANEYEGRARFFRDKAASLRARARELRDTKPPVVGHARGSGLCPTTGSQQPEVTA
jgi:hypothetical protein